MNRTPVKSSQLAEIGHDPESNTLEVQFHPTKKQKAAGEPGSVYRYGNISAELFAEFMKSESLGSYFIHNIKANSSAFPYSKVS